MGNCDREGCNKLALTISVDEDGNDVWLCYDCAPAHAQSIERVDPRKKS